MFFIHDLPFWCLIIPFSLTQDAPFFIYCNSENCTEPNGLPCERMPPCAPLDDCRELPMTEALRFTINHFHNQIRATVATTTPGASKMRALKYNRDLETVAQCWINTCATEKSSCLITPQFKTLGQNLATMDLFDRTGADPINDPASLWQDIINIWTEEMNEINAEIILKLPPPEEIYRYEHYTQIVTDYTSHLGCAWSSSNETIYFACFYGPQGCIPNHPVYEFGSSCSKCPEGTECYKPLGLCALVNSGLQHWKIKLKKSHAPSAAPYNIGWNVKTVLIYYVFLNIDSGYFSFH